MNKQPSKESLKDKVKGIFGLGSPRPPSKQSESKPSEFIITRDILKVCKSVYLNSERQNNNKKIQKNACEKCYKWICILMREISI
uniref:Uncharacterized protein n=1 Tax=Hucho hucho TaxID=62062 RepID=A0A4W5LHA4_9TELE